jgi:hypothetical protein
MLSSGNRGELRGGLIYYSGLVGLDNFTGRQAGGLPKPSALARRAVGRVPW